MGKITRISWGITAVMATFRAALISAVVLLLGGQLPARAIEPLPVPTGEVILTVDGKIAAHNTADGKAQFDLAMLQALPKSGFRTTTIWTDGMQAFEGVSFKDLLARLGGEATGIYAFAANDYEIRFPAADATDNGGIIAYRLNGEDLPVTNKGPLWIVYPYDADRALQSERFQGESVWSLETITLY